MKNFTIYFCLFILQTPLYAGDLKKDYQDKVAQMLQKVAKADEKEMSDLLPQIMKLRADVNAFTKSEDQRLEIALEKYDESFSLIKYISSLGSKSQVSCHDCGQEVKKEVVVNTSLKDQMKNLLYKTKEKSDSYTNVSHVTKQEAQKTGPFYICPVHDNLDGQNFAVSCNEDFLINTYVTYMGTALSGRCMRVLNLSTGEVGVYVTAHSGLSGTNYFGECRKIQKK